MGYSERCLSMYSTCGGPADGSQWSKSVSQRHSENYCFDWHCIPIISAHPPTSPLLPPLIWLPLQRNEGQRVRESLHTTYALPNDITAMLQINTAKKHEQARVSRQCSQVETSKSSTHEYKPEESEVDAQWKECMQACPCVNGCRKNSQQSW